MDVPFVLTRELQLNQRTVELLNSKKQVIVFGHIGHMLIQRLMSKGVEIKDYTNAIL